MPLSLTRNISFPCHPLMRNNLKTLHSPNNNIFYFLASKRLIFIRNISPCTSIININNSNSNNIGCSFTNTETLKINKNNTFLNFSQRHQSALKDLLKNEDDLFLRAIEDNNIPLITSLVKNNDLNTTSKNSDTIDSCHKNIYEGLLAMNAALRIQVEFGGVKDNEIDAAYELYEIIKNKINTINNHNNIATEEEWKEAMKEFCAIFRATGDKRSVIEF